MSSQLSEDETAELLAKMNKLQKFLFPHKQTIVWWMSSARRNEDICSNSETVLRNKLYKEVKVTMKNVKKLESLLKE